MDIIVLFIQIGNLIGYIITISIVSLVFFLIYRHQFNKYKNRFSRSNILEALKEKEMLKQLFNNMPDRIYFKDRESRFIIANKHVSKVMGEDDPEKLVGKTDFDFYEEKYAKDYYDDEQIIMKSGKPMVGKEEKGLDLKGNEIFVSTTKIPIFDNNKNVIGIIGIGRDITPQKLVEQELRQKTQNLNETNQLLNERQDEIQQMSAEIFAQSENVKTINAELERLSLVASKTENVVVIMDGNGNFEWVNRGFEDKYGMSLDEFRKERGNNLRDSSSNTTISAILNQIYITRKGYTYNSKFTRKDGTVIWNQTNISPILNAKNEISHLVLIDTDITELKKAENQINEQKEKIEAQTEELIKSNATKDRLFSIIAHDLKNPFHTILGFVDLLKKRYMEIERDKLHEFLIMINDSTLSAYHLLENLLEWARIQTHNSKANPELINIHKIVTEIISLQTLQASNKSIALINEIDKNISAYADSYMLTTVIRNISGNAIKFTNDGGEVKFSSTTEKNRVIIKISDSGMGMTQEVVSNLFSIDKVKSSSGTYGETGTGLGLIICSEFIKLNKGSLGVESEPGKGSTFIITLPEKPIPDGG